MKRMILFSLMALMTIAAFGRKHVENATVVADTIFYAENMSNVTSADQASYYRLLMTTGSGLNKKDVFQDFYMNGNLRAEGGYSLSTSVTIAILSLMVRLLPIIRMVRKSGMATMSMVSAKATSHSSSVKAV